MAGNTVIALQDVSKRFDSLTAVDQTSLQLIEGEFFALLGPSGCGKTTLLRMIAGFETPDEGTILLDGRDITNDAANIRPINLMFQSYALFPHMSVQANISYGLEMERLSRAEIKQRVGEMIELTQLTELSTRRPSQLSGGQRQRVALARALIKKPRVLLLDEPLGALDRKLREQMQLELKRLQHELGITFVVVTHDQEEALVMADRIALMNAGSIAQLGEPETIYEQPASRFVAQFVGVTNLFEGKLSNNGIELDGLGSFSIDSPAPPGTSCTLSVRPERIELSLGKPLPNGNAVLGTLFDKAYHGQDMSLLFTIENRDTLLTVRTSAADQAAQHYSVGQQIWCNWRPENGRVLTD